MEKISYNGRVSLSIYRYYLEQNIVYPVINNQTNFLIKAKEDKIRIKRKKELYRVMA